VISKSQFDRTVTISGFSWCLEPITIGINSFTARILCRDHNTALSPVDDEARAFRDAISDREFRQKMRRSGLVMPKLKIVSVDGLLVERWFLKTLINIICCEGDVRPVGIFDGDDVRGELVEIAFGQRQFEPDQGLFASAVLNEQVPAPGGLRFQTLTRKKDRAIVGLGSRFHGHRFWLALTGAPEMQGQLRLRQLNSPNLKFFIRLVWPSALLEQRGMSTSPLTIP
jgi:hypothetical protein